MLRQAPTDALLAQWAQTAALYRPLLRANRVSAQALIQWIRARYPLRLCTQPWAAQVIVDNVMYNDCFAAKLPAGTAVQPVAFWVECTGAGAELYRQQDASERGTPIFVGIDAVSGFFHIEGSHVLWDACYAFRGWMKRIYKTIFA